MAVRALSRSGVVECHRAPITRAAATHEALKAVVTRTVVQGQGPEFLAVGDSRSRQMGHGGVDARRREGCSHEQGAAAEARAGVRGCGWFEREGRYVGPGLGWAGGGGERKAGDGEFLDVAVPQREVRGGKADIDEPGCVVAVEAPAEHDHGGDDEQRIGGVEVTGGSSSVNKRVVQRAVTVSVAKLFEEVEVAGELAGVDGSGRGERGGHRCRRP